MSTWSDSFHRSNGSLGNGWYTVSGNPQITSQCVRGTGNFLALQQNVNASGDVSVSLTLSLSGFSDYGICAVIKGSVDGLYRYYAYSHQTAGGQGWHLYKRVNGVETEIGSHAFQLTYNTQTTLTLSYESGQVRVYSDGVLKVDVADTSCASYGQVGIYGFNDTYSLTSFSATGTISKTLTVSPTAVGTDAGDTELTLTATGVTWTTGEPGSPLFTVDRGAILSQVIDTSTTATIHFMPPAIAGAVWISDNTNGIGCALTVVGGETPPEGGTGWEGIPEAVRTWLEAQAEHGGLVLADNDESGGSVSGVLIKNAFGEILLGSKTGATAGTGYSASADLIRSIFARVWGGEEYESVSFEDPGTGALKTDLLALLTVLSLAKTGGSYDVGSLARELSGFPGGSHQDILDAISGISGGDNQDVLDAISAMQGDPLATVKAVLDLVYALGTTSNYDLQDVLDAVAAVRGTDNPTIRDVLNKLGTSSNTIEARIDALSDLVVTQGTLQGMLDILLTAITGGAGVTIASATDDIIDAVNAAPAASYQGPPVFPGADFATLGTAVALVDGMTITGPMDGVIVAITGQPSHAHSYPFGSVESWSHVGQIMFFTDNGDYERAQSFGIDSQVLTPTAMEQAAGCVIRLNAGWTGTVQPWVREA